MKWDPKMNLTIHLHTIHIYFHYLQQKFQIDVIHFSYFPTSFLCFFWVWSEMFLTKHCKIASVKTFIVNYFISWTWISRTCAVATFSKLMGHVQQQWDNPFLISTRQCMLYFECVCYSWKSLCLVLNCDSTASHYDSQAQCIISLDLDDMQLLQKHQLWSG